MGYDDHDNDVADQGDDEDEDQDEGVMRGSGLLERYISRALGPAVAIPEVGHCFLDTSRSPATSLCASGRRSRTSGYAPGGIGGSGACRAWFQALIACLGRLPSPCKPWLVLDVSAADSAARRAPPRLHQQPAYTMSGRKPHSVRYPS